MRQILILLFLLPLSSFAMNHREFAQLSSESQVEVLKSYKIFLSTLVEDNEEVEVSQTRFWSLIESAHADGAELNCFYAGWPSNRSSSTCSSPSRGNPGYSQGNCGAGTLQCNPILYGENLCARTSTRRLRNSALAQCENLFSRSARSLSTIATAASSSRGQQAAQDLFGAVERICSAPNRPSTCGRLNARVLAIRAADPAAVAAADGDDTPVDDATLVTVARGVEDIQVAAENTGTVDCDPNTPGIQTEPPTRATLANLERTVEAATAPLDTVENGFISITHTRDDQANCPNAAQINALKIYSVLYTFTTAHLICGNNWMNDPAIQSYRQTNPVLAGDITGQDLAMSLRSVLVNRAQSLGYQNTAERYYTQKLGNRDHSFDNIGTSFANRAGNYYNDVPGYCSRTAQKILPALHATTQNAFSAALIGQPEANSSDTWNTLTDPIRRNRGIGNCTIPSTLQN